MIASGSNRPASAKPATLWYRGRSFYLLITLILFISVHPVLVALADAGITRASFDGLMVVAVLFAVRAVTKNRGLLLAAIVVALAGAIARSTALPERYGVWIVVCWLVILLAATVSLFRVVLRVERVTADKIFAAVSLYLLMGVAWGLVFIILDDALDGAFTFPDLDSENKWPHLIQFSFTTLTTLGYGDISPHSIIVRSLANLEALIGQLYLVILVARLVALQIADSQSDSIPGDRIS